MTWCNYCEHDTTDHEDCQNTEEGKMAWLRSLTAKPPRNASQRGKNIYQAATRLLSNLEETPLLTHKEVQELAHKASEIAQKHPMSDELFNRLDSLLSERNPEAKQIINDLV